MKKYLFLILAILVLNANVFAQKTKKRVKDSGELPRTAYFLKTHPFGLFFGPNIAYEQVFSDKSTVQFEIAYLTKGAPRTADAPFEFIPAPIQAPFSVDNYLKESIIKVKSGYELRIGYKFFTESWANGYYIMPQLRYKTYSRDLAVTIPNGEVYNSLYQKNAISGAVIFGYQKFYNNRIFFDAYGGFGRSQTTESYTFGGGIKPVSTWPDNYKETYKDFSWNLHIGLMVGYRFGNGNVPKNISRTQKNGTGLLD